ncbi:MAG: YoaK family protein [Lachnospiraceae bacterium]
MKKEKLEYYIHFAMSATGGFFGAYAIINYDELFANAQTTNMMKFVVGLVGDSLPAMLLRLMVWGMYVLGLVASTWIPKKTQWDVHLLSVIFNFIAMFILFLMPSGLNPYIALIPVFFVTAFQWNSFKTVGGYVSATIFSTNNLKQLTTSLTEYACDRKPEQLNKAKLYGKTLLSYYGSALVCAITCKFFEKNAILVAAVFILLSGYLICCQKEYFAKTTLRQRKVG